jgi:hypothetical protein
MSVQNELYTSIQSSLKKLSICSVYSRKLSLTSAGVIHSHGHGSTCAGSGCPPAPSMNVGNAATCVSSESECTATTSLNVTRPTVGHLQSKC